MSATADYTELIAAAPFEFDTALEPEVQTDKDSKKAVPCRECKRPLLVNAFYAAAKAQCSSCRGETAAKPRTATVGVPQPGRTDPAKAVNLKDCLINQHFAQALCPVHPDDEDHVVELISVSHTPQYGPTEHIGYKDGKPQYRQIAPGETVLYQCQKCKATTSYSTTAMSLFQRQNAVRDDKHVNGWAAVNGVKP
jgi:DNA-directed RNA polymerase subunit M/transcription elongation factor TFIIS